MTDTCWVCHGKRDNHLVCSILGLLQQWWPQGMLVSQLMHDTGMSEPEVNLAIEALVAEGEDILRIPEPDGANVRDRLHYRYRQPILKDQTPEGQTSADPV